MSNHIKEAGIVEFIGPLLKRLNQAKERVPENSEMKEIINQISIQVGKTKDILNSREKLDRKLAGYFGKIERQIDPLIEHKPLEKAYDLPQKETITEVGESSNTNYEKDKEVSEVQDHMYVLHSLDPLASNYLESLLIFPKNPELKKRLVIYWWVVLFRRDIEHYESLFCDMVDMEVLIPVNREHNNIIDHFTIKPIVYKWLISNSKRHGNIISEKMEEGTWRLYERNIDPIDFKVLLNLDQKYLNSKNIIDNCNKHANLRVIQLGSWRYKETDIPETRSEETKSKDHIEVDQTDFLNKLDNNVRFLSLRGISGITEIHESIGKLEQLEILDLRACHNLGKLPHKPRSTLIQKFIRWEYYKECSWFDKLEVLDISECYLLDHMPKWICGLTNLVVLKGFVVASLRNKFESCQLADLSKLDKLRKLSIRIGSEILGPEAFRGFNSLDCLMILTITWGNNKYQELPSYSLPKNLEKLDIRCYPGADGSKLQNRDELTQLKRLYIRGGNLTKIICHDNWRVEILRLRFLKKLVPTDWNVVRSSFKNLKYVEYVGCPLPENFPNKDGNSWCNEE